MRFCAFILILLSSAFAVSAQNNQQVPPKLNETFPAEPCKLKAGNSLSIRGLRLEMPKADVQKEYPLMTITSDPVNSSGIAMSHQISNPAYQDNLDRITIAFKNDKIFSILFTYDSSINWDSAEEFADKISKSLNLPKAGMRKKAGGIYYAVTCTDFIVRTRINTDRQPTLFLTKDPDEMFESMKDKKDAFKP